jgi:hypothetical protein
MKTTIDIPEPLYRDAKIGAVKRGTSLRRLVLRALERELYAKPESVGERATPRRKRFREDETGWPVLRSTSKKATIVTRDIVEKLRDEEGV